MAAFFKNLPDAYVAEVDSSGKLSYRLVKNIFRRVIVIPELKQYTTAFESYFIPEGMRPDMVAQRVYGDSEFDWIILLSNNITDIYTQWPKDPNDLITAIQEKYDNVEAIHHWETNEIKLDDGTLYVKQGIFVNENYRVIMPDGTTLRKTESIYSISNFEHETYLNDKKRLISLPTPNLIEFFDNEFRDLVDYLPHKELDENGYKKTVNSLVSQYLNTSSFTRASSGRSVSAATFGGGSTTTTNTTTTSGTGVTVYTTADSASTGGVG